MSMQEICGSLLDVPSTEQIGTRRELKNKFVSSERNQLQEYEIFVRTRVSLYKSMLAELTKRSDESFCQSSIQDMLAQDKLLLSRIISHVVSELDFCRKRLEEAEKALGSTEEETEKKLRQEQEDLLRQSATKEKKISELEGEKAWLEAELEEYKKYSDSDMSLEKQIALLNKKAGVIESIISKLQTKNNRVIKNTKDLKNKITQLHEWYQNAKDNSRSHFPDLDLKELLKVPSSGLAYSDTQQYNKVHPEPSFSFDELDQDALESENQSQGLYNAYMNKLEEGEMLLEAITQETQEAESFKLQLQNEQRILSGSLEKARQQEQELFERIRSLQGEEPQEPLDSPVCLDTSVVSSIVNSQENEMVDDSVLLDAFL